MASRVAEWDLSEKIRDLFVASVSMEDGSIQVGPGSSSLGHATQMNTALLEYLEHVSFPSMYPSTNIIWLDVASIFLSTVFQVNGTRRVQRLRQQLH